MIDFKNLYNHLYAYTAKKRMHTIQHAHIHTQICPLTLTHTFSHPLSHMSLSHSLALSHTPHSFSYYFISTLALTVTLFLILLILTLTQTQHSFLYSCILSVRHNTCHTVSIISLEFSPESSMKETA